jgi:serine/threonine protein kinase
MEFLLGRATDKAGDSLAEHLRQCERCRETAISMSSPSLVDQALRSREQPGTDETIGAIAGESTKRLGSQTGESQRSRPSGASGPRRIAPDLNEFFDPAEEPDEIGRIGPYRVLKQLGEGGMGIVFQAEDAHLGRPVALKVMKPSTDGTGRDRQRFLREARAIAAIDHENIVTIYQVSEQRGIPYFAMQLLSGETLETRLKKRKRLHYFDALRIGRQVAKGLAAAHACGLIHRDIKPGNVWLESGRDRVKLLDFGLARDTSTDVDLTHAGMIVGTPAYMAPEQAAGEPTDYRSDLFSLGCLMYRMCAGVTPFTGHNTLAVLRSLAVDTPRPLNEVCPDVPRPVSDLIMKLLAKAPDERPPSAQAVADIIRTLGKPAISTASTPSVPPVDQAPVADGEMTPLQRALAKARVSVKEVPSDTDMPAQPSRSGSMVRPTPSSSTVGPSKSTETPEHHGGGSSPRIPGASPMGGSAVSRGTDGSAVTGPTPVRSPSGSPRSGSPSSPPSGTEPMGPPPDWLDDDGHVPVLPPRSVSARQWQRRSIWMPWGWIGLALAGLALVILTLHFLRR